MSPILWLDLTVTVVSIIFAISLFLIVLGTAPRSAVNRSFALFAAMDTVWLVSGLLLRLSLWLQPTLPTRSLLGNSQLWLETSVISISATGSAASLFTVRFLGRRTRGTAWLLSLGLLLTATLSVLALFHQVAWNPRLDASGLVTVDVSPWGWVVAVAGMALITWSLGLFWVERYRVRGMYLGWGLLILLVGTILGGLSNAPIPLASISHTLGMILLGYGVIDQQLLNPLRERTIALEHEIAERRKVEEEVKRRTKGLLAVSELALRCAVAPPETDFSALIAEELQSITGGLATIISTYDAEARQLVSRYIAAGSQVLSTVNKLFGQSFVGMAVPVSPEMHGRMLTEEVRVSTSLTETTFGKMPRPISDALQQLFGISSLTGLALHYGGELVGTAVIVMTKGQPELLPDVARAFGRVAAVSLRRQEAEEARRESEERYRFIFDHAADGLVRIDEHGTITDVNQSLAEVLGIEIVDYVGKQFLSIEDLLPQGSQQITLRGFEEERIQQGRLPPYEVQIKKANGELLDVEIHARPITRDGRTMGKIVAIRDASVRKRAEEALLQASRLEATATLAGGIAHRFNNLMVGVLGYAEMLKLDFAREDEALEMLDIISRSATRASELAQQLLAFARGGRYRLEVIDLNNTVQAAIQAQSRTLPSGIQIVANIEPELCSIKADPAQMSQVMLNLLTNAVEAIEHSGLITVATGNVVLDEAFCLAHPDLRPGPHVHLSVQDTGCGIGTENLPKIFDPFFTTKLPGRGLGLAAVYGIVKNHGGHIVVQSQVEAGSKFEIYLPALQTE